MRWSLEKIYQDNKLTGVKPEGKPGGDEGSEPSKESKLGRAAQPKDSQTLIFFFTIPLYMFIIIYNVI